IRMMPIRKTIWGINAQVFDSLEIDSTFYHIPRPEVVTSWHGKTPDDFRFAAKSPKVITHDRGLADVDEILTPFLSSMALLGVKSRVTGCKNGVRFFQQPFFGSCAEKWLSDETLAGIGCGYTGF
ncbi:MAG: DUF72 domain-containing protein, partial [Gemmatimonadota bacterium]|nr:DUF72 domain-containing protein [Gemmatimonadota bacterium]